MDSGVMELHGVPHDTPCTGNRRRICNDKVASQRNLHEKVILTAMRWSLMLFLSLLLVSLRHLECGRTRAIDYDALEKAWEAGDEQQELRTEGRKHYRQIAEKNEDEAKALGPQMIFVILKGEHQLLPDLASHWKEMLWNGGIEVNIYEVADSKLLVGLQKGIFVNDVMRFLDEQHEVKEYEWNGKAYSKESHRHYHKHHKTRTKKPQRKKTKGPRAKDSKFGNTTHKKRHRKPTQTLFAGKDSTEMHDEL